MNRQSRSINNTNSRPNNQPRYGAGSNAYDRNSSPRVEGITYGRQHQEENADQSLSSYQNSQNYGDQYRGQDRDRKDGNTFNQNPDRNRKYSSSMYGNSSDRDQYGRADRLAGGDENFASRGYSQQAGGWGPGRDQNLGSGDIGRKKAGGQQQYPATDHQGGGERQSTWWGNPSPNSDYGNEHMNWDENKESHSGRGPKNYKRSDERIHEDVSEALTHSHDVDASEIEVAVADGVVTLTGTVSERKMKRAAEDCIEHLNGVKDVKNNLTVGSSSPAGTNANSGADSEKSGKKPSTGNKLQ